MEAYSLCERLYWCARGCIDLVHISATKRHVCGARFRRLAHDGQPLFAEVPTWRVDTCVSMRARHTGKSLATLCSTVVQLLWRDWWVLDTTTEREVGRGEEQRSGGLHTVEGQQRALFPARFVRYVGETEFGGSSGNVSRSLVDWFMHLCRRYFMTCLAYFSWN